MLVHSPCMRKAIDFAVKAHEGQVRKGKQVPYIVHPLTVAMILSRVSADNDLIIAGILHDTVEDSDATSLDSIREEFSDVVANHVDSVTEHDKSLSWAERKAQALAKVESFTKDSLLLKSADVIANDQELIADHKCSGAIVFDRFNADAGQVLVYKLQLNDRLLEVWPENPLADDLRSIRLDLEQLRTSTMLSADGI